MSESYHLLPRWKANTVEFLDALRACFTYAPGETGAGGYLFSDQTPWPVPLEELGPPLLVELNGLFELEFTTVSFQAYRDGNGSCDWHYDAADVQVVLSLGATRQVGLRRQKPQGQPVFLDLCDGDLLFEPAGFQTEWAHCVPPQPEVLGERCAVVFRTGSPWG